jgi:hypothetical protein
MTNLYRVDAKTIISEVVKKCFRSHFRTVLFFKTREQIILFQLSMVLKQQFCRLRIHASDNISTDNFLLSDNVILSSDTLCDNKMLLDNNFFLSENKISDNSYFHVNNILLVDNNILSNDMRLADNV